MSGPVSEGKYVSIDLDDVEAFREAGRREATAWPRALSHLPSGTYESVPVSPESGFDELMVYRPEGASGVLPVFVNLHGGGFVTGDWESDDPYCRLLCDATGAAVINVDYHLAPEHPFPGAVEQTHALLDWLAHHGTLVGLDPDRIAVGGHSAGGNLSAAACLLAARNGGPRTTGLIVDYAPLDLVTPPRDKPEGAAPLDPDLAELALATGEAFNAWYLPDPAMGRDPLASPVLATDLSGLPPTLVITAEQDVLRGEGDLFAARLAEAGVDVEHVTFPGAHGFTHVGDEATAAAAWDRMAAFLRRVLA